MSDRRLLKAVRSGDSRAFEILFRRYHAPLLSFCRHLTGRHEDAEDAVQHTFLAAHREIGRNAATLDLKPWLFKVAHNRCLSLLRSRRVREGNAALHTGGPGRFEDEPGDSRTTEGLSNEVERRDELRALVAELGRLPEEQRASLVLSELEALSHAEIAQVLGVAPAKVRSLVFQARSSLISTRAARETPCREIRMQLATLRGSSLRRRTLRRHVRMCEGCGEFDAAVRVQRGRLAVVLPVIATHGLRDRAVPWALAASAGKGTGAAGLATGGAALGGGATSAGGVLGGVVAAVTGSGAVPVVAAAVAVAAGGTAGIVEADVLHRVGLHGGEQVGLRETGSRSAPGDTGRGDVGPPRSGGAPSGSDGSADGPWQRSGEAKEREPRSASAKEAKNGDLPPGLARKAEAGDLPPGLAKKEGGLPPGLAKRQGGGAGGAHPGSGGNGKKPSGRGTPPGQGGQGPGARGRQGAPPGRGAPPGQGKDAERGAPPGHAKPPGHAGPPGHATPHEGRDGGPKNSPSQPKDGGADPAPPKQSQGRQGPK